MAVNNRRIVIPNAVGTTLDIPIEQTWDFQGLQESIEQYELSVLEQILNKDEDFEVTRFAHAEDQNEETSISYIFNFWNPNILGGVYEESYTSKFTVDQAYYYTPPFTKSFWKLDLYTSPLNRDQQAYITIILPTQQGFIENAVLNGTTNVTIKKPSYRLDYVGDKEGFFIYWLKKRDFLNITDFYMTAKFFDGSTGQFIKMMNTPQNTLSNPSDFPQEEYFYYKVVLDYTTQKYEVYHYPTLVKVGTKTNPITWYEYVNP
jgi:hypothetical protein